MDKSNNKNSLFIVITGIIISMSRFLLGTINTSSNDNQHILIIMAVVNYVALGFVLLFLSNGFYRKYKDRMLSSGLETSIKKKCDNIILIFSYVLLIIYFIFGILYLVKFKTNDLNDVISIIALAISIATNGLIDEYGISFYKLIIKIAKTKHRRQKTN